MLWMLFRRRGELQREDSIPCAKTAAHRPPRTRLVVPPRSSKYGSWQFTATRYAMRETADFSVRQTKGVTMSSLQLEIYLETARNLARLTAVSRLTSAETTPQASRRDVNIDLVANCDCQYQLAAVPTRLTPRSHLRRRRSRLTENQRITQWKRSEKVKFA